jgi:hypothetical protein
MKNGSAFPETEELQKQLRQCSGTESNDQSPSDASMERWTVGWTKVSQPIQNAKATILEGVAGSPTQRKIASSFGSLTQLNDAEAAPDEFPEVIFSSSMTANENSSLVPGFVTPSANAMESEKRPKLALTIDRPIFTV